MVWLDGGSGWLMSPPMVAAHFVDGFTFEDARVAGLRSNKYPWGCLHDDCLTTRIVAHILGSMSVWGSDLGTGNLFSIVYRGDSWAGNASFMPCGSPTNVTLRPASDLIAAHCERWFFLCTQLWTFPDDIYIYRSFQKRGLVFCKEEKGIVKKTPNDLVEDLRKTAVFVTLKDLFAMPKRQMPLIVGFE
jgi:hypothetical protein